MQRLAPELRQVTSTSEVLPERAYEKFRAVFGVPILHEDDALRAARTAQEMRDALSGLGVQARIGVNTGEVVTGTVERLATGDAKRVFRQRVALVRLCKTFASGRRARS